MPKISVPALRYFQNGRRLYTFAVDGKLIDSFATVPHVGRSEENGSLEGFQRPEIKKHIKNIREYLESGDRPIIPNAMVMAFIKAPKFTPAVEGSDVGNLEISEGDSCVLVDGQQRHAAIRDADIKEFVVSVVAFVSEDEEMQRETFVRVNSSQPLDRRFLYSLLPGITHAMSADLEKKRLPALLVDRLNRDDDSVLKDTIKTSSNPSGEIADGTMLSALDKSLRDGRLSNFRANDGTSDVEGMLTVLKNYWKAVTVIFADAWGADRKDSRIKHTTPVTALAAMMDEFAGQLPLHRLSTAHFKRQLEMVSASCHWTADDGPWDFGNEGSRDWDAIDNSTKGSGFLTGQLKKMYLRAKAENEKDAA
jgi:DGQHR domain-containing protein